MGGSQPVVDPNGQQGQQQQTGQQPDDLGDLIGDPPPDQAGTGEVPGDGQGVALQPEQLTAIVQQVTTAVQGSFQSEMDRRINQIVQRGRVPAGQQPPQQGQQQQDTPPPASTGSADERDARSAYREAWSDLGMRLAPEERQWVNAALPGLIRNSLAATGDPDSAGTQVAEQVQTQVRSLRKYYQDATVRALDQRGALDRSRLKGQVNSPHQNGGGGGQTSQATAQYQQGAEAANRLLQQRGLLPQTTGQTS